MTEFETQNTVDVVIDDRSLTEAKADLENALSDVPVDVAVEASGGGGGDGGQWQEQFSLSRERNRILREIAEGIDEGNFDRASRSAGGLLGGGAAVLGAGALLGVGALSSVLSNFSWPSLPEFSWPEMPDLEPPGPPPEPDWHPLDVVEPDPIEVVEPDPVELIMSDSAPAEDPAQAESSQTTTVSDPQPAARSDPAPAEEFGRELGGDPAGSDAATAAEGGTSSDRDILDVLGLGAAAAGGAAAFEGLRRYGSGAASGAGAAAGGAAAFLTPEAVGVTDPTQMNDRRQQFNKNTPDFLNLPEIPEDKYQGSVFSAEGREAQAQGLQDIASRIESALADLRDDVRSTQEGSETSKRTDVTVESNVTVDGATKRDVERAAEEAKRNALQEFNRQINGGRVR